MNAPFGERTGKVSKKPSSPGTSIVITPSRKKDAGKNEMVDLTVSSRHFYNVITSDKAEQKRRVVRRAPEPEEDRELLESRSTQIKYITGVKYLFQSFIRQHTVAALFVWSFLCLAELGMVALYLTQTQVEGPAVSWTEYDRVEWGPWFWGRVILSCVLLSQLLFAYSMSVSTIVIVILTTVYQLGLVAVALSTGMGWVTRMYVPVFLRCWPMRQYFLFVLDSIALMTPRNRKLDLYRMAADPITLFICLVFSAAAIFRIDQTFQGYPLNIGVSIYFIIVTVSTVGYGDIVPKTPEGKALVIVVVFIFLSKMPTFISVFRSVASIYHAYRSYKGHPNHFVVVGHVTHQEAISILDELLSLYPTKNIVFCNTKFPDMVMAIGKNPNYQMRTTFLTTDSLDASAFQRLKASQSCGLIIFPNREGHSPRVDDDVMLASRIAKRRIPHVPQQVWLRYGLHSALLRKESIIIEEHLKKSILATAMLLPGIIPFLVNIVRTAWTGGTEPEGLWEPSGMWDWKNQYKYSRRQTIRSFKSPLAFSGLTLRSVIVELKHHDLLVVGLRRAHQSFDGLSLDLDHEMEYGDELVLIFHPSHHKTLLESNDIGDILSSSSNIRVDYGLIGRDQPENSRSFSFYPYGGESVTDLDFDYRGTRAENRPESMTMDAATLIECLSSLHFTHKKPSGVPLEKLELNERSVRQLTALLHRHSDARDDPYCPRAEGERLEHLINNKLQQLAYVSRNRAAGGGEISEKEDDNEGPREIFIFVDLTSSIHRQSNTSVYEDIISQTIAQYQLFTMMRCISSIHEESTAVLITLRKYPKSFLQNWPRVFNYPLRYIRGQTSLAAHLNYALTTAADPARVRGILLYCSQMGVRDFGDIPVCSVETTLRDLITAYEEVQNSSWERPEQNIVVELECCTSCMQVSPLHTDDEWLFRGKDNFQDSLSFMMGRCFASNMLITLPFHAYRDPLVLEFYTMTLHLESAAEMFDEATWSKPIKLHSQTMFRLCGNKHAQFTTYGSAFEFLLNRNGYLAIGIFRLFPQKEGIQCNPRYFITNPPLRAPLAVDDIIYCLDTAAPDDS